MRIYALEILFAAGMLSVPAAAAEMARRDIAPLPQFMPPVARGLANAESERTVQHDARQAAEALSAKFSDDRAASNEDTTPGRSKSESVVPVAIDPPEISTTPAHVAVLRAKRAPPASASKKSKTARAKAKPKSASADPHNRRGTPADPPSNPVPGAQAGWQTGLIGMLTNPAFWH